jgi:hypothetical protein
MSEQVLLIKIAKESEETASMCVQGNKSITSVCREVVGAAQKAKSRSPRKMCHLGLNQHAWKTCCDDLLLFLYKIQKCPPLLEDRTERDIILL